MSIDSAYPTILPTVIAIWLFLAFGLLVPAAAFIVGQRMPRYGLVPHLLAFVWSFVAPFIMGYLTTPALQPGEDPGFGDGVQFIPLLLECALTILLYGVFFMVALYGLVARAIRRMVEL